MRKKNFIGLISFIILSIGIFLLPAKGYPDVDFHIGIGIGAPLLWF